ncbi:hypothetical protein BGZ51_001359 [Haplosporangium sp. Z 767]|nr:hypothetical protein BGZ51_001359 [Haplosporangium sp. Z 767]
MFIYLRLVICVLAAIYLCHFLSSKPKARKHSSSQDFRVISSSGATLYSAIESIPPIFDKKTGQYVIIWEDIQVIFKDAEYVKNSDVVVPFLRDENLDR